MKNILSMICATTLIVSASVIPANAASVQEMLQNSQAKMACSASCSAEYQQCVSGKSDYSPNLTSLAERTKMNMMAPLECVAPSAQCNASC